MSGIWAQILPAYGIAVLAAALGLTSRCLGSKRRPFGSLGSSARAVSLVLLLAGISTTFCAVFQYFTDQKLLPWWAVTLPLSLLLKGVVQISPHLKLNTYHQQLLGAFISVGVAPLLQSLDHKMIGDQNRWVDELIEGSLGMPIENWTPSHMIMMADFTGGVIARATDGNDARIKDATVHVKDVRRHLAIADKQRQDYEAYKHRNDAENAYRRLVSETYKWRITKEYVRQLSTANVRARAQLDTAT